MSVLYHDFTLPEARALAETRLVLPVMSLFSARDWRETPVKTGEYLLPPIYRECLAEGEAALVAEIMRGQLPFYGQSDKTQIRIQEVADVQSPVCPVDVIFAIDPLEQHGPHLNLATDYNLSEAYIQELLKFFPETARLNPLYIGSMRWGCGVGASVSLPETMLAGILNRYLDAIIAAGAKRITVVSTHLAPNHLKVVGNLAQDRAGARIGMLTPFHYLKETEHDCHAGDVETSLSLHLGLPVREEILGAIGNHGRTFSKPYVESISHLDMPEFTECVRGQCWNGIVGIFPKLEGKALVEELRTRGRSYFETIVGRMQLEMKKEHAA